MLVRPLTGSHNRQGFDCGRQELNDWKQKALPEDKSAFTHLIDGNNKIILKLESLL